MVCRAGRSRCFSPRREAGPGIAAAGIQGFTRLRINLFLFRIVQDNFEVSLEAKSSRVLCEPQSEPQTSPRDSGIPRHRARDEDLG
jgi:hypothetical protein